MKPLNLDNSPCSPVSSNCVIWAGPNIPCINLCKGDTISDVTFKLATELCTILDYLNVQNYDLTCFNLAACGPNNYQELLQFLIDRICAIENVPASVATSVTTSVNTRSADVSNYLMTASPCFGGGTITLVDYVQQAATQICNIFVQINIINSGIDSLNTRVATLETAPVPSFVLPSFILQCEIGTIIPTLPAGSTQDIDIVLSRFINEEWCPYKASFGSVTDLASSILSQCILGTDDALAIQYTSPGTQMQVAYPDYVASPTTLANAINNLWIALCDVRNAGKALVDVVAGDNITVTPVTTLVGSDELTTYTIAGKEAIVVGADDIIVTPVTVGNDTTYTISRPKEVSYNEAIGSVNVDDDPVPDTEVFHFPIGYNSLTYTNTTGVAKDYIVNVSFDTEIPTIMATPISISNLIAGGIITTSLGIDTIEWESSAASTQHGVSLFDGATITDVVDFTTTEKVQTVPGGLDVEARFKMFSAAKNVSCFKRLTLNNNESVSLKFKTLIAGYEAYVVQAQIYVQEI